ncbi:MAG TPA: acyl carrier protein [Streptosporangiales bacterium]
MQSSPAGGSGSVATGWTPDDAFACVRAAACRVLEVSPERVTPGTRLDELGADSLAVIEMAELMEDEVAQRYGHRVRVDDVGLVRACTAGQLADELWRSLMSEPGARTLPRTVAEREGAKGA